MLKIEKTVTASPEQLEIVVEGMRNAMNSWPDMDSSIEYIENPETINRATWQFHLGEKDEKLMKQLNAGGTSESKYRRMIPVWVTFTAPLYLWKEFDTYKVGTVGNSCSTMHKIAAKEFAFDDFSCENLMDWDDEIFNPDEDFIYYYNELSSPKDVLDFMIKTLNLYREKYNQYDELLKKSDDLNAEARAKLIFGKRVYWDQMIQLLPSSYNQKRTIMLNYEVLAKIYKERRHHKLEEWHIFCDWIETLPYSYLITGKDVGDGK